MDHRLPGKSSQEAVQFGSIIEQIVLLWDTLPKSSKQLQQAPMHPEKKHANAMNQYGLTRNKRLKFFMVFPSIFRYQQLWPSMS